MASLMASVCTFISLIIHLCHSQLVTQSATLLATRTNQNYAQVNTKNIGDTSNGWTLTVDTHLSWNWWINFHNDLWKFQSDRPSTLTMKIYTNSAFYSDDRDILINFSQNDDNYITSLIQMDGQWPNLIYPSCDQAAVPTASFAKGNVELLLDTNTNPDNDRLYKTTDGNNYTYAIPAANSSACCSNQSPMIFKIINYPVERYSKFIYTNPSNSGWKQQCGFGEAWSSDTFMEIYISGDDMGEVLNIYQIELTMEYDQTLAPTTQAPSQPPGSPTGIVAICFKVYSDIVTV